MERAHPCPTCGKSVLWGEGYRDPNLTGEFCTDDCRGFKATELHIGTQQYQQVQVAGYPGDDAHRQQS